MDGCWIVLPSIMCALKWLDSDFKCATLATELLSSLSQCGLVNLDLGNTYLSDRVSDSGESIESALDHIYISDEIRESMQVSKLSTSVLEMLRELVNNKNFKVRFENIYFFFILVLFCVKVGNSDKNYEYLLVYGLETTKYIISTRERHLENPFTCQNTQQTRLAHLFALECQDE